MRSMVFELPILASKLANPVLVTRGVVYMKIKRGLGTLE